MMFDIDFNNTYFPDREKVTFESYIPPAVGQPRDTTKNDKGSLVGGAVLGGNVKSPTMKQAAPSLGTVNTLQASPAGRTNASKQTTMLLDRTKALCCHQAKAPKMEIFGNADNDITCTPNTALFGPNGAIIVDGQFYRPDDYGSTANGHTFTCFYNTVCQGDANLAYILKQVLAPGANELHKILAVSTITNFATWDCPADTEVVMTYVAHIQQPLTCVSLVKPTTNTMVATTYWPRLLYQKHLRGEAVSDRIFIWLHNNHYQGLTAI